MVKTVNLYEAKTHLSALVERASREAFDHYCNDPALADLHPHRVNGTRNDVWHLFDTLEDLRPLLRRAA